MKKSIINWSGGKDSSMALYSVLQNKKLEPSTLFTTVSAENRRISMHGVREELLVKQAKALTKAFVTPVLAMHPKVAHA